MLGKVRNQSGACLVSRVGKVCSDKLGHCVLRLKVNQTAPIRCCRVTLAVISSDSAVSLVPCPVVIDPLDDRDRHTSGR